MFPEGITEFFPLGSVLLAMVFGVLFLSWWVKRKDHPLFLLYWALGLIAVFLFKIPSALLHAGQTNIVQSELFPFLFVTLPIYFLVFYLLIKGLSFFRPSDVRDPFLRFFWWWFIFAVVYFFLTFFAGGELSFAPVWAGHVLFFAPAQIFLFYELWQVGREKIFPIPVFGLSALVVGGLLIFLSSVLYVIVQVESIKRSYWFFSAITYWPISLVQMISVVFLSVGFFALARAYFKTKDMLHRA